MSKTNFTSEPINSSIGDCIDNLDVTTSLLSSLLRSDIYKSEIAGEKSDSSLISIIHENVNQVIEGLKKIQSQIKSKPGLEKAA